MKCKKCDANISVCNECNSLALEKYLFSGSCVKECPPSIANILLLFWIYNIIPPFR